MESSPAGGRVPVTVYLPDYYRTMAVRMYNFDGRDIVASPQVSAFITTPMRDPSGAMLDAVELEETFPTEEKAMEFRQHHPEKSVIVGSRNPMVSCVNVEGLPWVKRVFTSSEPAGPHTVKVFELTQ